MGNMGGITYITSDHHGTARESFYLMQWPGGSDLHDVSEKMIRAAEGGRQRLMSAASDLNSGDWLAVVDGRVRVFEAGGHPDVIEGTSRGSGGELGFGGGSLGARLVLLNDDHVADSSFAVREGPDGWIVVVDGRVIESDSEWHPSHIMWDGDGGSSGFSLGL